MIAKRHRADDHEYIRIRGARVHNLQNLDVDIPKNKLVVITGVSGSGKSSLAFDTIYAEAERRYIESLSAYARQFLGVKEKPDVDKIEGLSPAIAIDQKSVSKNPRSTVGTITEIYDYLRILFARLGKPHCPNCGKPVSKQTPTQITDAICAFRTSKPDALCQILAPIIERKKGEHKAIIEEVLRSGFPQVRFDGIVWRTEELLHSAIDKKKHHTLEVVVDRFPLERELERSRVAEAVELALKVGKGILLALVGTQPHIFSEQFACHTCKINLPAIDPQLFSFNNPKGACPECHGIGALIKVDPKLVIPNKNLTLAEGAIRPWMSASHRVGRQSWYWWQLSELAERYGFSLDVPVKELPPRIIDCILYGEEAARSKLEIRNSKFEIPAEGGFEGVIPNLERRWRETDSEFTRAEIEKYMIRVMCPSCRGRRLRREALAVLIAGKNIADVSALSVEGAIKFLRECDKTFWRGRERPVAKPLTKEILSRLTFLLEVGLDYITLERESTTLAGGEAQRIRLATQIGSGLAGVIYVLDEPSIGLHARDQGRLIETLKHLRDLGNTVIVVEHDEATIRAADWVIDVGPGAGRSGGRVIFEGPPEALSQAKTLTAEYLAGKRSVAPTSETRNLKFGKNQKFLEILGARHNNLKNLHVKVPLGKFVCVTGVSGSGKSSLVTDTIGPALLKHFYDARVTPGSHDALKGLEHLDKAIIVDQSPIGRTPRSNPATYTGAFSHIRDLFASTHLAKMRGYTPGRFSFNVKGGRCEVCEGQGSKKIEMYFLPDVYVECEECRGTRYNKEALEIEWNGANIAEVLDMTVAEALEFFKKIPPLAQKLKTLSEVGLDYLTLGQPAPTLSGGEAQRVKLATELSRRATGKTLYILDEPTTGLHFDDIRKLLGVLRQLVAQGNTVLVIEHELHVLANADWIIDLGPEGGARGGELVAEGTPEDIAKNKRSYTGQFLARVLK
jgi:excinuclease ABC subunit A